MMKTTTATTTATTKKPKKYIKALSNVELPTDPCCNMLQTLERRRKYISDILSDEHTLGMGLIKVKITFSKNFK